MPLPDWMIERDVKIEPMAESKHRPGIISYGTTSYGYDARIGYKFRVFKPYPCSTIDPKAFDARMLEVVDLTPVKHNFTPLNDGDMRRRNSWRCLACGFAFTPKNEPFHPPEVDMLCVGNQPADHILIPPHSFVLGETVEEFSIPRDVLCIVLGKSTYARCGLIVNVTPLEPEWRGKVTVEMSNTTPMPIKVYCGEGIMQCVFFRSDGMRESLETVCGSVDKSGDIVSLLAMEKTLQQSTCRQSYADKKGKYQDQAALTLPIVK